MSDRIDAPPARLPADETALLAAVSAERLWADVAYLASFDRTSGTDGEHRAMAYIADRLRAEGIAVEVHAFEAYLSYPRSAAVQVLAGEGLPRDIPAKTRAFSGTTGADGVAGEVVYVPGGHDLFRDTDTHRRLADADVAGKIVLSEAGSRRNMQAAQELGAVAYVHAWPSDEDAIHEGIVSPVWGAPTPETAAAFPRIPIVAVTWQSGQAIREALGRGPVRLRVHSAVETGWRTVRLPVASIPGRTPEFVLFSGHVDSWHLGATDNATGNAVTMEVARVLHARRDRLRRGVRCAFWPGHSTGRYAGSTWYADQYWQTLYDHCILHINCDSPGVVGATEYDPVSATADAAAAARALIRDLAGQDVGWERPVRAGDQSFWGAGVPSLFMGLSLRPESARAKVGGSGYGWWWHTEADTLDKVDRRILHLDAQIYALAAYRFAAAPVAPFRVGDAVDELRDATARLQAETGSALDLSPVAAVLERLRDLAVRFDAAVGPWADGRAAVGDGRTGGMDAGPGEDGAADGATAEGVAAVCRAQRRALRALVQAAYTAGSPFDHDPAVPQLVLPALQPARDLARLDPMTHEARLLRTRLLRQRTKVVATLTAAAEALEAGLAALS